MAKIELKKKEVKQLTQKVASGKKLTAKDIDILQEINKYRGEKKLKPLSPNKILEKAATERAKYIFENNDFSHKPKKGTYFRDIIGDKDYSYVGENLARKFKKKESMLKAWYKSPTHQKNILEDYDDTGIGTFGDVTVQIFGRKHKI
jgi:uncharacterized protein YkwD